MAAGLLLRPLPRRPAPAQAPDPGLLLWTPGPDRAPRSGDSRLPSGRPGALLPALTGLFSEEEDKAAGAQACPPPVPPDTIPKHSEQRMGWAIHSPRPQKEDAAPFQALPRDCVLHSAPRGHLAQPGHPSFRPLWAKCTRLSQAGAERPSGNLQRLLACCSCCCPRFLPAASGKEELPSPTLQ